MSFKIKEYFSLGDKAGVPLVESESERETVRAVYPLIRAINSGRLTRNFTVYTKNALRGTKVPPGKVVGYESWVKPYRKPVLTEHRSGDGFFVQADKPLGRVVWAGYKARKKQEGDYVDPLTALNEEGDGYMALIAAITDEAAAKKVLMGEYDTVSIGSYALSVIDSITGVDLVQAMMDDVELPSYRKGREYDGKLCYWIIDSLTGEEISYVNSPSDVKAGTIDTDVGEAKVQALLAEKIVGEENFKFYDAVSKTEIDLADMEYAIPDNYEIVDSYRPKHKYHFINTESVLGNFEKQSADKTQKKDEDAITQLKAEYALLVSDKDELSSKQVWSIADCAYAEKAIEINKKLNSILDEVVE